MHNTLALFRKDVLVFMHDRVALLLTFIVPALLTLLFGYLFGSSSGAAGEAGVRLLVVDEAHDKYSEKLVESLCAQKALRIFTMTEATQSAPATPITREEAERRIRDDSDTWRHALIIPADYMKEGGFGLRMKVIQDARNASEMSIVNGMIDKTLYSEGVAILFKKLTADSDMRFGPRAVNDFHNDIANSAARHFGADKAETLKVLNSQFDDKASTKTSAEKGDNSEGGFFSKLVSVERIQVHGKNKNYAVQNVGGWAVMFLLFAVSGSAASLLVEKHQDIFLRLLSGPATRSQILWSKFLFMTFMGFVQLMALMAFGHLFWNIFTSVTQILPICAVILCAAMACSAIGMVMAAFCKTEAQASGVSTLVILSMCAVGGAMFPLWMLPTFVQDVLAPMTPVFWAMDGCFAVLWSDAGIIGVLPHAGVLLLFAVILMPVAMWRFRTGDLFR